jgi:coatomer subunit beta
MLIMTSVIRVGQSKFVTVPIDEDSQERILNCIRTLSELGERPAVHEIFLQDTKAAYSKMLAAQEVKIAFRQYSTRTTNVYRVGKGAERKDAEATKAVIVQVDDLLSFRQFSKKSADDAIDVSFQQYIQVFMPVLTQIFFQYDEDVGRATGSGEVREDFISNLSRISQLTGGYYSIPSCLI